MRIPLLSILLFSQGLSVSIYAANSVDSSAMAARPEEVIARLAKVERKSCLTSMDRVLVTPTGEIRIDGSSSRDDFTFRWVVAKTTYLVQVPAKLNTDSYWQIELNKKVLSPLNVSGQSVANLTARKFYGGENFERSFNLERTFFDWLVTQLSESESIYHDLDPNSQKRYPDHRAIEVRNPGSNDVSSSIFEALGPYPMDGIILDRSVKTICRMTQASESKVPLRKAFAKIPSRLRSFDQAVAKTLNAYENLEKCRMSGSSNCDQLKLLAEASFKAQETLWDSLLTKKDFVLPRPAIPGNGGNWGCYPSGSNVGNPEVCCSGAVDSDSEGNSFCR